MHGYVATLIIIIMCGPTAVDLRARTYLLYLRIGTCARDGGTCVWTRQNNLCGSLQDQNDNPKPCMSEVLTDQVTIAGRARH